MEVTFSRERNPSIRDDHVAEAVVFMKGPNLVARESATTYEAAVDQLVDKLERQIERYRDKRVHEPRRVARSASATPTALGQAKKRPRRCRSTRPVSGSPPASRGSSDSVSGTRSRRSRVTARRVTRWSSSRSPTGRSCSSPAEPPTRRSSPARSATASRLPYRALAVTRPELWAVGAVAHRGRADWSRIRDGDELELTWNGSELELTIDRPARRAGAGRGARADRHGPRRRRLRGPRAPPARRSLGALGAAL